MKVADVNGLVVGSNVLLRGVAVGKVSGIESSVDGATVRFYIGDQFQVPVDSDVRLENLSALGESYIGLVPRTQNGPMLHNGQRIATKSIIQPPSISELATSVVRVLDQLDPGALERIVVEADTALPNTNSVLPNLSRTSRLLRNTVADMHGRGRELLDNFQTLLHNADWIGPVLGDLTRQLYNYNPHLRELFSTFPPLIAIGAPEPLYKFDAFLARIQKLLDNNGGDLKVLGDRFLPHLKGIAGSLLNFDTGQILTNLLDGMPQDGAITLHVSVPEH
jgi:virulence factor Mce-like protein